MDTTIHVGNCPVCNAFPVQHIAAGDDCTGYRFVKPEPKPLTLTISIDAVDVRKALDSLAAEDVIVRHLLRDATAPTRSRFIKVAPDGAELPADAKQWAAVLDTQHGLLWSADNVGDDRLTHAAAAKACGELRLCGHADWRLPTRAELLTLVDDTRHEPAIALEYFPTCRSAWYWTSSPAAWSPESNAWIVNFDGGGAYDGRRDHDAFVRAVRSVGVSPGQ